MVYGGCNFAAFWRFSVEEVLIGNRSAQSPANVWWIARPGHAMGHCKVKRSLCSVQQVCWSLHWVLRPGLTGGLLVLRFSDECRNLLDVEAPLGNHSVPSPASLQVASPGHALGHCKVKCSLCSVQQ